MSMLDFLIDGLAKIISDLSGKPIEECRKGAAWAIYIAIILTISIVAYKGYTFVRGKVKK